MLCLYKALRGGNCCISTTTLPSWRLLPLSHLDLSTLHEGLLGRLRMHVAFGFPHCAGVGMFGGGRWEGRGRNAENIRQYCREKILQDL